jgi:hypothetical protein
MSSLSCQTKFSFNKSFDEAYKDSIEARVGHQLHLKLNVLNLDDLIASKIQSLRPKDLLDVQQLKKINK